MAGVCLEHCHKITSDPEKRRARREEAERSAQAAADRILLKARQESRRMKRREGNRTGFEAEDADLNQLLPQEQLSMVDDVRRALGESEAQKLVYELGREGLLVAGFPRPAIYEPPAASRSPSPLSEISAANSTCFVRSDSSDSGEEDEEEEAEEDAAIPGASTLSAVRSKSGGEQSRKPSPVRSRAPSPLPKKRPRSSSPAGSDAPSNFFERSSVARTTAETEPAVKEEDKPQHPSPSRQPAATPLQPAPSTLTATALQSLTIATPARAVGMSSLSPRPSSPLPSPSPWKRRRETIHDFLPPPHSHLEPSPFATSSTFLPNDLQPLLVSLFPSSTTDSLSLTANTLVKAGVTSLSDLATLMLLDRRALKELVIAHELRRRKEGEETARKSLKGKGKQREERVDAGEGDVEAECLRLAEFFQRAREVWRDTMGGLGEGGGEGS